VSADRPELLVQAGADAYTALRGVAMSPDGHWYATGAMDGLQLWSVDLNAEIGHVVRPGQGQLFAIAADSKTIVTLGQSNYAGSGFVTPLIKIDGPTGKEVGQVEVSGLVSSMAASPSEMVVALLVDSNNAVDVRSLTDGASLFKEAAAAKAPSPWGIVMSRVFFSPDGETVFLSNPERLVGWEWRTGRRVLDLDAHAAYTQDLNRQVAVNYSNGRTVSTAREEHYDLLTSVNLARDGRQLIACSHDELSVFDWDSAEKSFKKRDMTVAAEGRINVSCGYFPGHSYYTTTISGTDPVGKTVLYDGPKKLATPIKGWVQAVIPVPRHAVSLVDVVSSPPLLLDEAERVTSADSVPPLPALLPAFSADGLKLWWGAGGLHPLVWDLASGEAEALTSIATKAPVLAVSGDGLRLAFADAAGYPNPERLDVADATNGKRLAQFEMYGQYLSFAPSMDANGSEIALVGPDGKLVVYQMDGAAPLLTVDVAKSALANLRVCLSGDGKELAVAVPSGVSVYALPSGRKLASFAYDGQFSVTIVPKFSPDGAWLALARSGDLLRMIDTRDWKRERHLSTVFGEHVTFSSDGKRVLYEATANVDPDKNAVGDDLGTGALVLDDGVSGKHLLKWPGSYTATAFSADGRFLVAQGGSGTELIEVSSGKLLATLYVFIGDSVYDWLVVTPDGLFDGSAGAWKRVSWRVSRTSFEVAPVEIFFREYYRPALLADLIAGKKVSAPVDLAGVDRRQPSVVLRVDGHGGEVTTRSVHIHLTVTESRAPLVGQTGGAGVRDVRLFRDGTLVKVWRGELTLDRAGNVELEAEVPIVAGENRFTAYGFNRANIKSNDAVAVVTGAESLARKGTAYVLSIGVNHYAANRPEYPLDLNYAEADATDFSLGFTTSQRALTEFGRVETVDLLSWDATRANIVAALQVLAGHDEKGLDQQQTKLFAKFKGVEPEDGVFVFYAGHGAALGKHFYLLPNDFDPLHFVGGVPGGAISEEDLSKLLEDISPSRAFLIIDACNSGKALDSDGVAGPMNSVGLAQLAYEKGIYILAASQGLESALEAPQLAGGHGYLTYALMEDGLKKMDAAQNGVVELRGWFDYADHRVPELQTKLLRDGEAGGRGLKIVDRQDRQDSGAGAQANVRVRQHPRVFYRREPEPTPFVVAKAADSSR
jgi:WD40 repeat protein